MQPPAPDDAPCLEAAQGVPPPKTPDGTPKAKSARPSDGRPTKGTTTNRRIDGGRQDSDDDGEADDEDETVKTLGVRRGKQQFTEFNVSDVHNYLMQTFNRNSEGPAAVSRQEGYSAQLGSLWPALRLPRRSGGVATW